jgi:hypothetical protein
MNYENAGFDYGWQLSFRFSFTFRGMGAKGPPDFCPLHRYMRRKGDKRAVNLAFFSFLGAEIAVTSYYARVMKT